MTMTVVVVVVVGRVTLGRLLDAESHGRCREGPQAAGEAAAPLLGPLTRAVEAPTPLPPAAELLHRTHTLFFWGFFLAPERGAPPLSLQGPGHTTEELQRSPFNGQPSHVCLGPRCVR